jgi:hypothetical protein
MMNVAKQINDLPDDIINLILEFIPYNNLVCINSYYYNSYHFLIKNIIHYSESYIRDMIRRDNDFVFKYLIRENFELWIKNRQYRYKNMVFSNYIYFVLHFCIEKKSERCRKILIEEFTKRDLCRNLHKKNVVKYIKWIS